MTTKNGEGEVSRRDFVKGSIAAVAAAGIAVMVPKGILARTDAESNAMAARSSNSSSTVVITSADRLTKTFDVQVGKQMDVSGYRFSLSDVAQESNPVAYYSIGKRVIQSDGSVSFQNVAEGSIVMGDTVLFPGGTYNQTQDGLSGVVLTFEGASFNADNLEKYSTIKLVVLDSPAQVEIGSGESFQIGNYTIEVGEFVWDNGANQFETVVTISYNNGTTTITNQTVFTIGEEVPYANINVSGNTEFLLLELNAIKVDALGGSTATFSAVTE